MKEMYTWFFILICRIVHSKMHAPHNTTYDNNARPSSSGGAHPNESFKKVPGSVLVPCRARGMPMDHNFKVRLNISFPGIQTQVITTDTSLFYSSVKSFHSSLLIHSNFAFVLVYI